MSFAGGEGERNKKEQKGKTKKMGHRPSACPLADNWLWSVAQCRFQSQMRNLCCFSLELELVAQCDLEYAVLYISIVKHLCYAPVVACIKYEILEFVTYAHGDSKSK